MDDNRFDALTKTLHIARDKRHTRRQAVRVVIAAVFGSVIFLPRTSLALSFCVEHRTGERCHSGTQCCSGRCKKKHGKHNGKCRCSALGKPCAEDADCCGRSPVTPKSPVCDFKSGLIVAICCHDQGGACDSAKDCCGNMICNEAHACVPPQ